MDGRLSRSAFTAMVVPLVLAAAIIGISASGPVLRQSATPGAGDCGVMPRPASERSPLRATPSPAEAIPAGLEDGPRAPAEVVMGIRATLEAVETCRAAGDVSGALSLFSDDAIRQLATNGAEPELVGDATASPTSPQTIPLLPSVRDADLRVLADGRVGAVAGGAEEVGAGTPELPAFVLFVKVNGRWLIDEVVMPRLEMTATPEAASDVGGGPIADAARRAAAADLGVEPDAVRVERIEAREWSDASLGCPAPDTLYAQVLTPGYLVVVAVGGRALEVHTDATGQQVVVCSGG